MGSGADIRTVLPVRAGCCLVFRRVPYVLVAQPRAVDGPGAPPFTKISAGNAPLAEGNFVIGPDYSPAPELSVKDGVPVGKVTQFTLESKDSKFYPGIARDVFGTPDPKNPKSLIVETHPKEYQRTITVYVPAQYRKGKKAPLIVTHDGPKLGEPDCISTRSASEIQSSTRLEFAYSLDQ